MTRKSAKKKPRKFDRRLTRHRGYGLIVCYLKENGPSRWSAVHGHCMQVLGIDNRKGPPEYNFKTKKNDLPGRPMARGYYADLFTNAHRGGYYYKRDKWRLTAKGRRLYDHLQDKAAQGLDDYPPGKVRLWKATPGETFIIGSSSNAYNTPTIVPTGEWEREHSGTSLGLRPVNLNFDKWNKKPPVWFPLDEGDEITYLREQGAHYHCIMSTAGGQEFSITPGYGLTILRHKE